MTKTTRLVLMPLASLGLALGLAGCPDKAVSHNPPGQNINTECAKGNPAWLQQMVEPEPRAEVCNRPQRGALVRPCDDMLMAPGPQPSARPITGVRAVRAPNRAYGNVDQRDDQISDQRLDKPLLDYGDLSLPKGVAGEAAPQFGAAPTRAVIKPLILGYGPPPNLTGVGSQIGVTGTGFAPGDTGRTPAGSPVDLLTRTVPVPYNNAPTRERARIVEPSNYPGWGFGTAPTGTTPGTSIPVGPNGIPVSFMAGAGGGNIPVGVVTGGGGASGTLVVGMPGTPGATAGGLPVYMSQAGAGGQTGTPGGYALTSPAPTPAATVPKLSRIEGLYDVSLGMSGGKHLLQFGYPVFAQMPAPPVGAQIDLDYVIGVDDEIRVSSVGALDLDTTIPVQRDGTIAIPKAGIAMPVAGTKLRDLTKIIQDEIDRTYKDVKVNASLGKLRSIHVNVVGELATPGLKLLPASATLMDAMYAAGGPTKDGTLRDVVLHRRGQKDVHVDLYHVLRNGTLQSDVILMAGDVVSVGPIGPTVAVISPMGNAIFELNSSNRLVDIVDLLGGINNFTQTRTVLLEHTVGDNRREVQTVDYNLASKTLILQDADVVAFMEVERDLSNTVGITGPVVRAGTYPYRKDMTVSDLLRLGGGLLINASNDRALIQRRWNVSESFDVTPGDARGRVKEEMIWVDLGSVLAGDRRADIFLCPLDVLKIYSRADEEAPTVVITGAVRQPGAYNLSANMTLGTLMRMAGGPTSDAYMQDNYITRRVYTPGKPNTDVQVIPFCLNDLLRGGRESDYYLENHDEINIRRVQALQVRVTAEGEVLLPNDYVLPHNARISDLLVAAGGLQADADLRAAVFTRRSVQDFQTKRLEDLFNRTRERYQRKRDDTAREGRANEAVANQLAFLGLDDLNLSMLRFQALGRVVLNFTDPNFVNSCDNLVLEDGDRLIVPKRLNTVYVMGRVLAGNAFVWREGQCVSDYLRMAGGFTQDADEKQLYVVMSSGEVKAWIQKDVNGAMYDFKPGPGDTVLVPPKALGRSLRNSIQDAVLLARDMAELGLIGATIPQANNRNTQMFMQLNSPPRPDAYQGGNPYGEMIQGVAPRLEGR